MQEKTQILIIGDELGLGEQIREHFKQLGMSAHWFHKADEALPLLSSQPFDYIFIDCMLQGGMNGVDLASHVRANFPQPTAQYVLMSAVFTDKSFIKDAIDKTGAISFIEKRMPFDMTKLSGLVKKKKSSESMIPDARKTLYEMFGREKMTTREKRRVLESLEEVSGFDLPFIYSLLVETGFSGYLNIYESNGSVSGVTLCEGFIVGVDADDEDTYFGRMLIQSGYCLPQDVEAALAERTNLRIGAKLVNSNLLSPHAFDLILTEQMNLRLSRSIADKKIRVHFAATEIELVQPNIGSDQLAYFLHDWIASKISESWLRSLYMMWASNEIRLAPAFHLDHPALGMGLLKGLPGLVEALKEGATLNSLLTSGRYAEGLLYKGLHFLLTKGLIVFGARISYRTAEEQHKALVKLQEDIRDRSPVEIVEFLGVANCAGDNLMMLLGDKPSDPTSALGILWNELKVRIEEAGRTGSSEHIREQFQQSIANKNAEAKLAAGAKMEKVKKALSLRQFSSAYQLLQEVQTDFNTMEQLHLFLAWAKIGLIEPAKKAVQIKEIEMEMVQIPAEERYDAHYPLVLGMFQRAKGDFTNARKSFEKALAMDSAMIAARRELTDMMESRKDGDILNMDLSRLVGGWFGRK